MTTERDLETANNGSLELKEARDMARWLPDYLLMVEEYPGSIPTLAENRLRRLFGEGEPVEHLEVFRDTVMRFKRADQANLILYFCGFPDSFLAQAGSGGTTVDQSLSTFSASVLTEDQEPIKPEAEPLSLAEPRLRELGKASLDTTVAMGPQTVSPTVDDAHETLKDTPHSADTVGDYMRKAGRHELLSAVEEVELSRAIEAGLYAQHKLDHDDTATDTYRVDLETVVEAGKRARDAFMTANLRLAINLASKYSYRSSIPREDLIQEANMGLMRAVEKFDFKRGYKFSTYATWWIKQSLTRADLSSAHMVRVPVHVGERIRNVQAIRRTYIADHNRLPTVDELGLELNLGPKAVKAILEAERISNVSSLNTPVGDGDTELGDIISNQTPSHEDPIIDGLVTGELEKMLELLNLRDQEIIRMRFGLKSGKEHTLEEISKRFGVTRERIRQIEVEALKMLQRSAELNPNGLREYL